MYMLSYQCPLKLCKCCLLSVHSNYACAVFSVSIQTMHMLPSQCPFKLCIGHMLWLLVQVSLPFLSLTFFCRHTFTRQIQLVLLFWPKNMGETGPGILVALSSLDQLEIIQPNKNERQKLQDREVLKVECQHQISLRARCQTQRVTCLSEILNLFRADL